MMKSAILSSLLVVCIVFLSGFRQADTANAKVDGGKVVLTGKEMPYVADDSDLSLGGYLDEEAAGRRFVKPYRFVRPQYYPVISDEDYLGDGVDVKRSMSMLRLGKRGMGALRLGRK